MLRLANRVLSVSKPRLSRLVGDENEWMADDLLTYIPQSDAVIGDDVAEYVHGQTGSTLFNKDFGVLSFPSEVVWIEWKKPECVASPLVPAMRGVLIRLYDLDSISLERSELTSKWKADGFPLVAHLTCSEWCGGEQSAYCAPLRIMVAITQERTVGGFSLEMAPEFAHIGEDETLSTWAFIPVMTLSFMSCKNVVRKDVSDAVGPSRKWLRRQKQPEIRYHVLDINPMKQVLRTEGNIEANGLKKAMHICRGHFATYSEERPLFGKYSGRFWVPAHVKGSPEHGIVDKDYRIRLPGVSQ